jgi:hypothetical protein
LQRDPFIDSGLLAYARRSAALILFPLECQWDLRVGWCSAVGAVFVPDFIVWLQPGHACPSPASLIDLAAVLELGFPYAERSYGSTDGLVVFAPAPSAAPTTERITPPTLPPSCERWSIAPPVFPLFKSSMAAAVPVPSLRISEIPTTRSDVTPVTNVIIAVVVGLAGGPGNHLGRFHGFGRRAWRENTTSIVHYSVKMRGKWGAPGLVCKPGSWGGFSLRGVGDADGTATLLRERRSAFRHLQLLPAVAVAEEREGARCVCARTGEAPRRTGISARRVRGDAGACTPAGERARERNTFDVAAEVETASVLETAEAGEKRATESDAFAVRGKHRTGAGILAGAIL